MIWLVLVFIVGWLSILSFRLNKLEVAQELRHEPMFPLQKRCPILAGDGQRCYLIEGHETPCYFDHYT